MGGELTYTYVSPGVYNLNLSLYRDCTGIPAPVNVLISASSVSCGSSGTNATLLPTASSPTSVLTNCSAVTNTCNGGTYTGVERWDYQGLITLPSCNDWVLTYSDCCRNAAITNLQTPSNFGATFRATLNNLDAPVNNSPQFSNIPTFILSQGLTQTHNNGAFDSDGDSISISLTSALDNTGLPIPYSAGFSYLNPISTSTPLSVDPFTGDMTMTPSNPEVDVFAFEVLEFRNGVLIGSMTRDLQVQVVNSNNQLPTLSGINGNNTFVANVCSNDTLNFTLNVNDADVSDIVSIDLTAVDASGLTYSTNITGNTGMVNINWPTNISHVRSQPYLVYVKVYDNACPYVGSQTFVYQIYVNSCSPNVWPGDANSDLTCNMYDLLPIGLAYGSTGPVRSGASLAWVAQSTTDWGSTFISGVDYKHADCNGDGIIDANDTVAIAANYGLNHPFRISNPNQTSSIDNFYLIAALDTANALDNFSVEARLGNSVSQVTNLYGIAFRLSFLTNVIDTTASDFAFTNSWLGTPGSDMITFVRPNWTAGYIDAVAVRTDHQPMSGDSTIAVFDVVIVDNVSARTVLNFQLSGVRGVSLDGTLRYFVPNVDSVEINSGTTGITSIKKNDIALYPNPASESLMISRASTDAATIIIRNLQGETVLVKNTVGPTSTLDIHALPAGTYSVQLINGKESLQKKLMIVR